VCALCEESQEKKAVFCRRLATRRSLSDRSGRKTRGLDEGGERGGTEAILQRCDAAQGGDRRFGHRTISIVTGRVLNQKSHIKNRPNAGPICCSGSSPTVRKKGLEFLQKGDSSGNRRIGQRSTELNGSGRGRSPFLGRPVPQKPTNRNTSVRSGALNCGDSKSSYLTCNLGRLG